MKNILIKSVICLGLMLLLLISAGCEADFWPLSLLQSEKQDNGIKLSLPDKTGEEEDYDNETTGQYFFFYPDREKRFLVPITRRIPYTEAIAKTIIGELISNPELEEELSSVKISPSIPSNTTVRSLNIKEGLATVNFSASFLTYPEDEERLVMESILCSLKQFKSIEQVMVTVEGVDLDEFPGGKPGNIPLGPQSWINLEISDDVEDYQEYTAAKIYFAYHARDGEIFYVPVTRVINPQDDPLGASILELLSGPRRNSGLFTDIPSDTELLDFSLKDNIITLNLSSHIFKYQGGKTGEENIINQIVLTLTEHSSVEKVKILIDGKEEKLPGGTDLSQPFSRPEYFNFL